MVSSQNSPLPWYLVTELPDPPALQVCETSQIVLRMEPRACQLCYIFSPRTSVKKCLTQTLKKQWRMPLLLALRRRRQSALKLGSIGVAGIS